MDSVTFLRWAAEMWQPVQSQELTTWKGPDSPGNTVPSVPVQCHSEGGIRAEKSKTSAQEKQNITFKMSRGMLGGAKVGSKERFSVK